MREQYARPRKTKSRSVSPPDPEALADDVPFLPAQTKSLAVTVEQAAHLLGTNDKQIRRGIYARELPVVRFGKSYSIAVDDLWAWFKRKKGTL